MTALSWLKIQLLPLMMLVWENCLSPHNRTTLIFVVKMELSECFTFKCQISSLLTMSRHVLHLEVTISWGQAFVVVLSKYPHYWVCFTNLFPWVWKDWALNRLPEKWASILKHIDNINGMVVCLARLWVLYFPSTQYLLYYLNSIWTECMWHLV